MRCSAQDDLDMLITQIKSQCDKINSESKLFKVTEEDVNDLSSEGGVLKKFYENKVLKKAELTLFGETGQSTTQYYFHNGELIFAKSIEKMYKEPIYLSKPETDSLIKNEFYFKSQILVRWVDNNGKIVEQTQYLQKQIEILDDLKLINEPHTTDK
jgi:hypothetical protein